MHFRFKGPHRYTVVRYFDCQIRGTGPHAHALRGRWNGKRVDERRQRIWVERSTRQHTGRPVARLMRQHCSRHQTALMQELTSSDRHAISPRNEKLLYDTRNKKQRACESLFACPLELPISAARMNVLGPTRYRSKLKRWPFRLAGGRIEDEYPILAAPLEIEHAVDRSRDCVEGTSNALAA